ncbi:SRPBCC family protein [Paraflavitalea speifideaquila]|uniref:SRPBCC family protein n=1 Tax=Paraflavitalea speifideaquila TaxID=3076558 RepID=UPI0028EFDD1F|nr:SRPBCC family protein [Paraflavitalea speifideiaquila]
MNFVIILLSIIGGLVVLLLLLALFVKSDYSIGRSIIINKPRQEVFNYIKYLKNQDHFNKWVMMDPNLKKEFKGIDGTAGFIYAWEGNKQAGKGEQEIKRIIEGERLDVELRFVKPFEAIGHAPFVTESIDGNQTKLSWGLSSRMKYPMNIMLLFMNMDKLLGKDLDTSLGNLKGILEKQ